jgi:hypothetical protein
MGGGGGDGITLHKITQCADITRKKKKTWIRIHLKCARDNLRGQKSLGPLKMSLEMAQSYCLTKKNVPQFLKQRDINSYFIPAMTT